MLPAGLDPEQDSGPAALVPELIGDDPLQRDHEGNAAPPPARPQKSVEIDADHDVALGRAPGDADVVQPAVEGVKARPRAEGSERDLVAETRETADQAVDRDERAAAFRRARRGGAEDGDAHYRPRKRGGRFSRKARVPSR